MKQPKLTIRDFTFVHDEVIGGSYQSGPYAILVGTGSYACTYKGQTFSWGLRSILEAVCACGEYEDKMNIPEADKTLFSGAWHEIIEEAK
jgi:hypothetical protein